MKSILSELWGPSGVLLSAGLLAVWGAFWSAMQHSSDAQAASAKSDEIAKLNHKIANLVTGGEGFCYMLIGSIAPTSDQGTMTIVRQGEFPLYEVKARIVDLDEFKAKGPITFDNMFLGDTNLSLGTLPPYTAAFHGRIDLGPKDQKDFNVFFSARNGLYTQNLSLRKIDGTWRSASRVKRVDEKGQEQVVFEFIDPHFPSGQLDWK